MSLAEIENMRYEVRYLGQGRSIQNSNSNPSGKEYIFENGMWTNVDELDFLQKYELKVRNAVNANIDPKWDVRTVTKKGEFVEKFKETLDRVRNKEPKVLADILSEDQIRKLKTIEIFGIQDFLATPRPVLLEKLRVDKPTLANLIDKARKAQ